MLLRKALRVLKTVLIVLVSIILAINLYIIGARLIFNNDLPKIFGFAEILVLSGSMSPTLEAGDMIIIHEEGSYNLNDIITYRTTKSLLTHRIVEIKGGQEKQFVTKGDFNNVNDAVIPQSVIEGKVVLRLPGVGNISFFLRTPFGILCMVLGVFLLIEVPIWIDRSKRSKK